MTFAPANIPHNQPEISQADIDAVVAVMRSGYLAGGPAVQHLEDTLTKYFQRPALSAASGTAALFLALKFAGPDITGLRVAVPTYTCSAVLDAVIAVGGVPVLVDIRPDNLCIDASDKRLDACDAVVAVHSHGHEASVDVLVDMDKFVVEDICQAMGGVGIDGQRIGTFGAAAATSFYATKIVCGGEGGAVIFRDDDAARRCDTYLSPVSQQVYAPRFNLRMSDLTAALVASQLQRLDAIVARRQWMIRTYLDAMPTDLREHVAPFSPNLVPYRFVIRLENLDICQRTVAWFAARAINANTLISREHLLHRQLELDPYEFPNAEASVDTTLSLPLSVAMSDADVHRVADAIHDMPVLLATNS